MRTWYERDYDSDPDEPSWRRDEREHARGDRQRYESERNRNLRRSEPRYRPEQAQVGRGYGGEDRRYADQSYWDADERNHEWGARPPEDTSRYGRERNRHDRFASGSYDNSRYDNSRYDEPRGQQGGYGSYPSTNRLASGLYGSRYDMANVRGPRDAWDDESYGRVGSPWGNPNGDRAATGRSYGATRADGFIERITGGQSGKGPKGYVRSDERIREDVCDRLSVDDEIDASDVTVTVKGGEVTLEGSVVDRHSKHRAEDITDSVPGVRDVTNRLRARKGLMSEIGDKLTGEDEREHHGHSGSGTRNGPGGTVSHASSSGTAPRS
jgi:hypothetical protein